jgi:signal transduction histidine kinase/DNA-binding NarL/FixJ family response regulator
VLPFRLEQITLRFLLVAMSISAALAVFVASGVAWWQFEAERERLSASMANIARLNAIALQEPMWSINDRATNSIVGSLSAQPEIFCAEVTEPEGTLAASTLVGGCGVPGDADQVIQQVVYGNQLLGHLTLWVDRSAIAATARVAAQRTALVYLLLSAAMVVSAVFALRTTVMAPLARLTDAIRTGSRVEANPRPDDELGQVITAYNRSLDRMQAHTAEIEEARTQAVAAAQAKSRFLATMSHEIRTPMHGVLGTVELLRGTQLTDEQRQHADIILHSTEALLGIINDILDLSKIEAGKVRIALAPARPRAIVEEVVGALAATAQSKGVALKLAAVAGVSEWVLADALRLRQVVMNLVGNAVKFTEAGAITVSLARYGDGLEIAVADTGIGIADDDLARLFEPFRQVDASTTRRHGGTGLGLSISKQLVELMGGSIQVESEPGRGSTFRVLLPLVEACEPALAPPAEPAQLSVLAGARVLAAEDNPVNQWLLRSQLQRLGYRADIHADGRAALAAFKNGGYVAVVTDYHMPIMDGLDLARAIRAAEGEGGAEGRITIIGMTADAYTETVDECLRAGMDEVVTKPVSLEQLGGVLACHIAGHAAESEAKVAVGAALAEPPLLDDEITEALFGDDAAGQAEMAKLFAVTADGLRAAIDGHLADGDALGLREAAHSLASAALSLGATRLGLAARALECAAKDQDWFAIPTLAAQVAQLDGETRAVLVG